MEKAIGIGAGGHAKVVAEIVQLAGIYEVIGLIDSDPKLVNTKVGGLTVLGGEDLLPSLRADGVSAIFIGVGSVGDASRRRTLFETLQSQGFAIVSAVHPKAIVSPQAALGTGAIVMGGAIINPGTTIGDNVIINTGAIVDHDCVVGSHVHIAPGATLSGTVTVGEGAHIGVGATVRQGISIGERAVVGAGAVVVRDVPPGVVVTGVPARPRNAT